MRLETLLPAKKKQLLGLWLDRLLATYPPEAAQFFKGKENSFDNPVGTTFREGLEQLLDALIEGRDPTALAEVLEPVVKIRAVQDLAPSDALGFLLELKQAVRELLRAELRAAEPVEGLAAFERAVDALLLCGVDVYVACREQVHELRIADVKRSTSGLLRTLNRRGFLEDPDEPLEPAEVGGVCAARLKRGLDS